MLTQANNFMMKRIPRGINNFTRKNRRQSVSLPMPCSQLFLKLTLINLLAL